MSITSGQLIPMVVEQTGRGVETIARDTEDRKSVV